MEYAVITPAFVNQTTLVPPVKSQLILNLKMVSTLKML
jgi:hypothetical protein